MLSRRYLMATPTKSSARPLYAIAGAGDLAVAKLRELSDDVTNRIATLDQEALQARLAKRQAELSERFEAFAADARTLPAKLRELPAFAQAGLTTALGQAEETYEELAGRGQKLVTRIRHQQATEDLVVQARTTVTKAKAARTTARKTADTASRSLKATTTSARKTAKNASKAAGDAATKIGD
jgi:heparin binding hemagglutinin HbhA